MTVYERDVGEPFATKSAGGGATRGERGERGRKPRTDYGTIILHWVTAIAMVFSLATGLRISADAPESVVGHALTSILPQGEIWTWHFIASLVLFFCATTYTIYIVAGRLTQRSALTRARALTLPAAAKLRWNAINVLIHWAFYVALLVLMATGVAMYLGYGGWVIAVHAAVAISMIGYIVLHVVAHFMYGGLDQWLRVFKPSRLAASSERARHPLLLAAGIGVPVAVGLYALDLWSRDTLQVKHVAWAPTLDGQLDDAVWAQARPVRVQTEQGFNLGGTGMSLVEVRAIQDDKNIYFAFKWEDPTRSLARVPVIKKEDGWHLMASRVDLADVPDYYEDKFAVLFTHSDELGNGGTSHMGPDPLPGVPKPLHARGYHYTTDGLYADVWQWKATRGGVVGRVDDMYFGPPNPPTEVMTQGKARYQAGYDSDPEKQAPYYYIYKTPAPGAGAGVVELTRLPRDIAATTKTLGHIPATASEGNDEDSRWYMREDETVPFTAELDVKIPVGTILPTVVHRPPATGDRGNVTGAARWSDGHWTLEAVRALSTGSKYDIPFVGDEPIYMYLSVFDHNQTRHSRHMRPVRLELGSR